MEHIDFTSLKKDGIDFLARIDALEGEFGRHVAISALRKKAKEQNKQIEKLEEVYQGLGEIDLVAVKENSFAESREKVKLANQKKAEKINALVAEHGGGRELNQLALVALASGSITVEDFESELSMVLSARGSVERPRTPRVELSVEDPRVTGEINRLRSRLSGEVDAIERRSITKRLRELRNH